MKLNPPATSSDIEAAREVARRLHQRRRREDRPGEAPREATERPAPFRPVPVAAPRPAPPSPPPPVFETPEPPSWDEADAGAEPAPEGQDPLAGFGEPAPDVLADDGGLPPVEIEDNGISPEEMVGAPEESPFEEPPSEPGYEGPSPFEEMPGEDEPAIEQLYESTTPPSWDEIVDACLAMAQATGAMLVDPSGQVFAARGEWPEPGPDAIAAKLVSTMERTLKDAPTRSISAPLHGQHLTAWRVPLAEGLLTAAFIGEAPVRAEARPAIDSEILRGAGG
jgi:hypothetical protein